MKESHEVPGAIVITGRENIANVRLLALRSAAKLEIRTKLRLSRGGSVFKIIKKEFGLTGNNESVYAQFDALVTERTGVPSVNLMPVKPATL